MRLASLAYGVFRCVRRRLYGVQVCHKLELLLQRKSSARRKGIINQVSANAAETRLMRRDPEMGYENGK